MLAFLGATGSRLRVPRAGRGPQEAGWDLVWAGELHPARPPGARLARGHFQPGPAPRGDGTPQGLRLGGQGSSPASGAGEQSAGKDTAVPEMPGDT